MDVDVISGYIGCQTLLVMGLVNYQQLAQWGMLVNVKEDEIGLFHNLFLDFRELLGNIILCACLVWGFVAALGINGIILQIPSKFP